MSEPTQYDNQVTNNLNDIITQLQKLENDLYNRHAGCVCNEQGLCSHHAAVSNKIKDGVVKLMGAVKEAQRVE